MENLLSLQDVSRTGLNQLLWLCQELKSRRKVTNDLKNSSVGLLFLKPSTRTRTSFEVATHELGGKAVYLYSKATQLARGEPVKDVARVLSRYLHGLGARVYEHEELVKMAENASIPIVNLLSDEYHPTQIIGDLLTIKEKFGGFDSVKLTYLGDGNNVCNSLLLGASKAGVDINVGCPDGYEPDQDVVRKAKKNAKESKVKILNDPKAAVTNTDIIYTDVHVSMGQEKDREKMRTLEPYKVDRDLVKFAKDDYIFMHCLPRHGEEVSDSVFESKHSVVFDQAENRLHSAKAILTTLMAD